MCAEKSVQMTTHFRRKLGAGFFGGEGFIMQKLTGPGVAFVELDGEIVEYTLEPGQLLKVDTGHVAMFEPTVQFDIEMVRGFKNILFGGEGLFLATLRGPGRVWLQTMPGHEAGQAPDRLYAAKLGLEQQQRRDQPGRHAGRRVAARRLTTDRPPEC